MNIRLPSTERNIFKIPFLFISIISYFLKSNDSLSLGYIGELKHIGKG